MSGREFQLETEEEAGCNSTPNEPWTVERNAYPGHFYVGQADFALAKLPDAGKCLVIGSPIFEAQELIAKGLKVTYLDVRDPQIEGFPFVHGDATKMAFANETFDCASSTCVICHVGLGRYGDEVVDDGDVKMLQEIGRVLKPLGKLAITFGPVGKYWPVARVGRRHRIYSIPEVCRMCKVSGLKPLQFRILNILENTWCDDIPESSNIDKFYLSMYAEKHG